MDEFLTLDYGSGGKKTSSLISDLVLPAFDNPYLRELGDGAVLPGGGELVVSTDSFVVSPRFFPGGDIGKLSVCGTVNDVSMAGGDAKYVSLAVILEEGFPKEELERIVSSIAKTAKEAGVSIVTGDTKVVEKGRGDGIYINTTGIGFLKTPGLSPKAIRPGDRVLLSGTAGDHGTAVMLARNPEFMEAEIESDCGLLKNMALALGSLGKDLRVMRDPTRGGLLTTLNEFVEGTALGIELSEADIPVRENVRTACDMLGLDPLYCASEGRLIAVTAPEKAEEALGILRSFPEGKDAAVIGTVTDARPGRVVLRTSIGGTRIAGKLTGAQLPRIC